jgi:hypothetical protein
MIAQWWSGGSLGRLGCGPRVARWSFEGDSMMVQCGSTVVLGCSVVVCGWSVVVQWWLNDGSGVAQ